MDLIVDSHKFDYCQIALLDTLIETIDDALAPAYPDKAARESAVSSLTFHICTALDGGVDIQSIDDDNPDKAVTPIITFASGQFGEALLSCGGSSWMHEYAQTQVEQYFDRKLKRPSRTPPMQETRRPSLFRMIKDLFGD